MNLQNTNILITGGARIGQFVAKELQSAGATIFMSYLKEESEAAPDTHPIQLDVTSEASVNKFFDTAVEQAGLPAEAERSSAKAGEIHALINMVSIFKPDNEQLSYNDIDLNFKINAFGNMVISRRFSDHVKEQGRTNAPIVSFIDWAIDHPYAGYDTYLAAKAALRHYLMSLQTSYAGTIRCVNIHPGMILEPPDFPAAEKQSIIDHTPTKQIGSPEQAAQLVRAALELDYLAGNVPLDGGQSWRHRLKQ